MRISIQRVNRTLAVPSWAIGVVALWGLLVLATVLLSRATQQDVVVCMFRNATGVPCPTCGLTRATESMIHGRVITAIMLNPLAVAVGTISILVVMGRMLLGIQPRIDFTPTSRKVAWLVGVLLVLINWGYVIWHELWIVHSHAG
jgi:hypothetical protein